MSLWRRVYLSVCAGVCLTGLLALLFSPWFEYRINLTSSLPGTLYLVRKGAPVGQGDLVAYRWQGGATYPPGSVFIKQVAGMAGDRVRREGRAFWVNDHYIGLAKTHSKAGVALEPASGGVIAPDEYFVATPNPDSLDSRYSLGGNVRLSQVIGRAYEVF